MIGDLLSRMNDAEKLSPQQLQQTVKDGVLPAGVANMISQSTPKSMPQEPPPGTVADQIINQADQAVGPEEKIMQHINLLKRDIGKIQEGVQSGEIKAYEGIPLLKEKVDQLGKLQAMLQPQMPQMPPQGINTAQSNLPTQMAEGGIIGYAKGGTPFIDADEEDDFSGEEDYQNALKIHRDAQLRRQQEQEAFNAPMGEGMGAAIMSVADTSKPSGSSFVNKTPNVQQAYKKETGGIQDIINSKAQKYNLPIDLLNSIAKSESNFNPNAGNKTGSSAKGLYQFLDTTWKGMGGKEGEQFDPEINSELGAKYIRQNAEYLKNKLGRDPSYSEVYGAHFFGPSGAAALLSKAKPDMPIEQGLATFESDKRVKTIMNQNPNLKGKTVGQVFGDLERKTGQGIVSLAKGGEIPSYSGDKPYGSVVTDDFRSGYDRIFNNKSAPVLDEISPSLNEEDRKIKIPRQFVPEAKPAPKSVATRYPIVPYEPPVAPQSGISRLLSNLGKSFTSGSLGSDVAKAGGRGITSLGKTLISPANIPASVIGYGGYKLGEGTMSTMAGNPYFEGYSDPMGGDFALGNAILNANEGAKQIALGNAQKPIVEPEKKTPVAPDKENVPRVSPYDTEDAALGEAMRDQTISPTAPIAQEAAQVTPNAFEEFINQAKLNREDIKKQRDEDKYMALLAAGLGMAGGTSPYAAANIGQGALAGVQNLGESRKIRAAEQAAIDKNILGALHYGSVADYYKTMGESVGNKQLNAEQMMDLKKNAQLETQRKNAETAHNYLTNHIISAAAQLYPPKNDDPLHPNNAQERNNYIAKQYASPWYRQSLQRAMPGIDLSAVDNVTSQTNPSLDLNKYMKK